MMDGRGRAQRAPVGSATEPPGKRRQQPSVDTSWLPGGRTADHDAALPRFPLQAVARRGSSASVRVSGCRDAGGQVNQKHRLRHRAPRFSYNGSAASQLLRAWAAISHKKPPADSRQPLAASSQRAFPSPSSPHPAAKRFVRSAFPIGFAMRKALGPGYPHCGRPFRRC